MPDLELARDLIANYREENPMAAVAVALISGEEMASLYEGASADDRFEIGSITKLFTATLVADSVLAGRLRLEEDLSAFVPAWKGLSVRSLLNHTSGLPRLPWTMLFTREVAAKQPYARWTRERLRRYLRLPVFGVRGRFNYSNLGYAALGLIVEKVSGLTYADSLVDWARRHGFQSMTLEEDRTRDLVGHDLKGNEVAAWRMAAFSPAGGIRANLEDMAMFVKLAFSEDDAAIRLTQTEVSESSTSLSFSTQVTIALSILPLLFASVFLYPNNLLVPALLLTAAGIIGQWQSAAIVGVTWLALGVILRLNTILFAVAIVAVILLSLWARRSRRGLVIQGLGWQISRGKTGDVYWHNGGTAGFRSFIGISRRSQTGVVILSSSAASVDSIGFQLLQAL